ncbi:MAG: ImmA/IrrE family metallo-endopeptidase [Anaerovoracaceae bacterium]
MAKIEKNMTDEQRYNILKNEVLKIAKAKPLNIKYKDFTELETFANSRHREKIFDLAERLGVLNKELSHKDIPVVFSFSKAGARKSMHEQIKRDGEASTFVKALSCFDEMLENSKLIEVHSDKYKNTIKANEYLESVYVMISSFSESKGLYPIQLEIKSQVDKDNRLYLLVSLTDIKKETVMDSKPKIIDPGLFASYYEISLTELFSKINAKDKEFLKYVPDNFLSLEQLEAKKEAINTEQNKIEALKYKDQEAVEMKSSYIKNPSKEEREKWREKASEKEKEMSQLVKDAAETYQKDPAKMAEFFSFAANFYNYSPKNTMLIMAQSSGATVCDSYKRWKEKGYPVQKGAEGVSVFVPVTTTFLNTESGTLPLSKASKEQKEAYKKGELKATSSLGYKLGTVFDISQTSFPKEEYPRLLNRGENSFIDGETFDKLKEFCEDKLYCKVQAANLKSIGNRGEYHPVVGLIRINEKLDDTARLSTLTHEIGHAMLHNSKEAAKYSEARAEFEADAVSIMLNSKLDIPLTESRKEHLAHHYKNLEKELDKKGGSIDEIFSSVYKVFDKNMPSIEEYIKKEPTLAKNIKFPSINKEPSLLKAKIKATDLEM